MALELKILAGHETKKFLVDLEAIVVRMEKAAGMKSKVAAETESEEEEEEGEEEEENDFAAGAKKKTGAKKKGASFEDESEEEEEESEEEEKPAKKAGSKKPPKFNLDDVNDACKDAMERLGGNKAARKKVIAILTDKFDCENGTVTELKSEQYGDVITAMNKAK